MGPDDDDREIYNPYDYEEDYFPGVGVVVVLAVLIIVLVVVVAFVVPAMVNGA